VGFIASKTIHIYIIIISLLVMKFELNWFWESLPTNLVEWSPIVNPSGEDETIDR
jgi:hypothetical protein